jgi:protein CrcB
MAGGALGAALRFIIGDAMLRQFGNGFPWGTLTVNLVGAFAVGYVVVWLQTRGSAALYWRAFAIVGIIGGLTTFSSMMLEAVLLGVVGGVAGLMLASLMQFIHISTLNWQSFSELAFSFTLTPRIIVTSMLFAVLMGVIGGFLPAVRAARLSIVDALRAA